MKCRAAIYCRLSKEDIDKENREDFSRSIKNQETMLLQFAKEQDFRVVKRYHDDDYSGLYEDRPGFERPIEDAKSGTFFVDNVPKTPIFSMTGAWRIIGKQFRRYKLLPIGQLMK